MKFAKFYYLAKILLILFIISLFSLGSAYGQPLTIAVASNFVPVMNELTAQFTAKTHILVRISSASTGILAQQISSGAPYQIFLAADSLTPTQLIRTGYAIASSSFTYARGRLILWSAIPGFIDSTANVLTNAQFSHLAIANPSLAPYGQAAYRVLTQLGLLTKLASKIIQGNNITQTYQYVASKNAELGFISLSQVYRHNRLSYGSIWHVPLKLAPLIHQDAVLLTTARQDLAAHKFMDYLQSAEAQKLIHTYGYE